LGESNNSLPRTAAGLRIEGGERECKEESWVSSWRNAQRRGGGRQKAVACWGERILGDADREVVFNDLKGLGGFGGVDLEGRRS